MMSNQIIYIGRCSRTGKEVHLNPSIVYRLDSTGADPRQRTYVADIAAGNIFIEIFTGPDCKSAFLYRPDIPSDAEVTRYMKEYQDQSQWSAIKQHGQIQKWIAAQAEAEIIMQKLTQFEEPQTVEQIYARHESRYKAIHDGMKR